MDPRGRLTGHLRDAHQIRLSRAEDARTTLAELAALDPCPPPAAGDLGRDASGYRVWRFSLGDGKLMDARVSECCGASAKGSVAGGAPATVCRACYAEIDSLIGGEPNPPFINGDGQVTGLTALGWSRPAPAERARVLRMKAGLPDCAPFPGEWSATPATDL
jgi:hypothetical protein